jgi:hypothetical protein
METPDNSHDALIVLRRWLYALVLDASTTRVHILQGPLAKVQEPHRDNVRESNLHDPHRECALSQSEMQTFMIVSHTGLRGNEPTGLRRGASQKRRHGPEFSPGYSSGR